MRSLALTLPTLALLLMGGCVAHFSGGARGHQGTTRLTLSGPAGSSVALTYTQDEKEPVATTVSLPWQLEAAGVSRVEVRKNNQQDKVLAEFRYDRADDRGEAHVVSGRRIEPGTRGIIIRISDGFVASDF